MKLLHLCYGEAVSGRAAKKACRALPKGAPKRPRGGTQALGIRKKVHKHTSRYKCFMLAVKTIPASLSPVARFDNDPGHVCLHAVEGLLVEMFNDCGLLAKHAKRKDVNGSDAALRRSLVFHPWRRSSIDVAEDAASASCHVSRQEKVSRRVRGGKAPHR